MRRIDSPIASIVLKVALYPSDKSTQKERVMHLWERELLTAGDVERLLQNYGLVNA